MKSNIGQGDKGITSIFAEKVSKYDVRISAYGDLDELNSYIGLIRSNNKYKELDSLMEKIQKNLFVLGSSLTSNTKTHITKYNVKFLEDNIKKFEKNLPPLKNFILPTGSHLASLMHITRAVCRRVERNFVSLSKGKKTNKNIIPYVNRLSDLLFTLARWVNNKEKIEENGWKS